MNPFIRVLLLMFICVGVVSAQETIFATERLTLTTTHTAEIWSVESSSDGNFVASIAKDGDVEIHDLRLKKLHWKFSDTNQTRIKVAFGFSVDGNLFATGVDRSIQIRSTIDKKQLYSLNHNQSIDEVQFSNTGEFIAAGYKISVLYTNSSLAIWSLKTREILFSFPIDAWVVSISFSKNDRYLTVGDFNGGVHIFDLVLKTRIAKFQADEHAIWATKFHPNSKWVALGSSTGRVILFDFIEKKLIYSIETARNPLVGDIDSLEFDKTGNHLFVASNWYVYKFNSQSGALLNEYFFLSTFTQVTQNGEVFVGFWGNKIVLFSPPNPVTPVTQSPSISISSFNQSLKPVSPHQSIDATLKGCIRINTANPETVTCRITFAVLSGETPVQAVSIRAIDTASRVVTPYQFSFLIPNAIPSKNATLTTSTPLTLEFYMSVAKDIVILPILDVKVGNSSLWEYTARFTQVPIGR
jgi:WD40 repeat protein